MNGRRRPGASGPQKAEPQPPLDEETVADEGRLSMNIDVFMCTNQLLQRHEREVLHRQRELRAIIDCDDDDAWEAFLHLDNASTDRVSDLTILLVRWAFNEGVWVGRRGGAAPVH